MAAPSCEECKAIYQELVDLVDLAHQDKPGPNATPQQLVDWFDQQAEDEDYKMRARSALLKAKHRMIEHQKVTGHNVPLPLRQGGLTNTN
jgi:hypothetical protein